MQRLFRVTSLIDNVRYRDKIYDKVIFTWFMTDRDNCQFPYEDLIINYKILSEKEKKTSEKIINELFTESESKILKSELDRNSNSVTTINEVKLPVPDHISPYSELKIEEGTGFSDLSSRRSYNLPFGVKGFFNINDSYESISGDDNPTVVTKIPEIFIKKK